MKKRLARWLRNKYILASLLFLGWVTVIDEIDLFFIIRSRLELRDLVNETEDLRIRNEEAREALHDLSTNTATLEKYAREQYFMKRANEDVFVFKERAD